MGVEPTGDSLMPPYGFEVRGAHRDPAAPLKNLYWIDYTTRKCQGLSFVIPLSASCHHRLSPLDEQASSH